MKNIPNRLYIAETEPLLVGGHNNREWPLGQLGETPDGRLFRYALNGAVITVAANLYQSAVPDAGLDTLAITANAAIGAKTLAITNGAAAIVEDEWAFGTACIEETLGTSYPIKTHGSDGGSGGVTLTFQDGVTIQAALTTATETVNVLKSPYRDIVIHGSVPTAMPVGVPLVVFGIAQYGWIQTHGITNILVDAADGWTAGWAVRPSDDHDGAVQGFDADAASNAADTGIVGKCAYAGVDTTFAPIFLTLE